MTSDLAALEQMDPAVREHAVTQYLEAARDKLTLAVNLSGPEAVAAVKAEIATAAEATRQLGLSKEIQTDALEMVRRAEYALGKAIRAGQDRGDIARKNDPKPGGGRNPAECSTISPGQFFTNGNRERTETYAMAEATSTEFDVAISDARAEDDLTRANVVRKIKGVKSDVLSLTPIEKLIKVRELAPTGRTSDQIAKEIGASEDYVRRIAKRSGIEITADRVMNRSKRGIDSNNIVQETVTTLEGLVVGIGLVNFGDLDPSRAENWAVSLTESIRALNRLTKQIKEMTQ